MLFALKHWNFSSVLSNRVPDIVTIGSEKQMLRINAGRSVATMQDVKSCRNLATVDLPRYAMRTAALVLNLKHTVTFSEQPSRPKPAARIWLWHEFSLESLFNSFHGYGYG